MTAPCQGYHAQLHTAPPLTCRRLLCLPPQQRAFLLARQREREGRFNVRGGSPGAREGGYGGYESEDSMDSFIDDGDEEDWRSALRQMTGEERLVLATRAVCLEAPCTRSM